jgi:hypothetical protein
LELEKKRVWIAGRYWFKDPPTNIEEYHCQTCQLPVENDFYQCNEKKWHSYCFHCSTCANEAYFLLNNATLHCQSCICTTVIKDAQVCTHVTILQQYLHNLKSYLTKLTTQNNNINGICIIYLVFMKHD